MVEEYILFNRDLKEKGIIGYAMILKEYD